MLPKNVRLTGRHPLAYMGVDPSTPPLMLIENRSPTTNDYSNVNVGAIWVVSDDSTQTYEYWVLVNINSGFAHWVQLYPGAAGGATSIPCDIGTATVASGVLKIFGGVNLTSYGSQNIVTMELDDNVVVPSSLSVSTLGRGVVQTDVTGKFFSDEGPGDGYLLISSGSGPTAWAKLTAGTGVTINNGPNSITINSTGGGGGTVGALGADDSNTAIPDLSGVIKVLGGANIETTAPASPGDTVYVALKDAISLPSTNLAGTAGVININSKIFMSAPGTDNTFLGSESGKLTLTTASQNVGIGGGVLSDLGTSDFNTGCGFGSLLMLTNGNGRNTALGGQALGALEGGERCIGLGYFAGINYAGSEASNICLGDEGVLGESNALRLGTHGSGTGQQDKCWIAGIYGGTNSATNGLVTVDSTGKMASSSGAIGQVIIGGTTGVAWANFTSSDNSIIFTKGENQLDMVAVGGGGGGGITKLGDDGTGIALPILGQVDIKGGNNIDTVASTNMVTVNLHDWISLPVTTAAGTAGGMSIGGTRFMHAIGNRNTYLGTSAGNLGASVAYSDDNVGIGANAMQLISRGHQNVCIGSQTMKALVGGSAGGQNNVAIGYAAFPALNSTTTGANNNVALGAYCGTSMVSGTNNTFLGTSCGSTNTSGSNNLLIGYNVDATTSTTSNEVRIGNTTNNAYILGGFSGGANVSEIMQINRQTGGISTIAKSTTPGNVWMVNTAGNVVWGTLSSSDNSISITPALSSTIDIKTNGTKVAFHAYQSTNTLNVTGNGDLYNLGANSTFAEVYDYSNSFYPGSGSGLKAEFTAPKQGLYMFIVTVLVTGLPVPPTPVTPTYTRKDPINIVTSNRFYSLINPVINYLTDTHSMTVTFSAIADMDVNDTAYFQYGLLTDSATKTVGIGATYTTLSGFFIA